MTKAYTPLSPKLAWQLCGPHTWAATIAACAFAFTYSSVEIQTNSLYGGKISLLMTLVLFLICVLMQSAVNVFDDYFDYKKGTDTQENSSKDKFDAVLVYNRVNPKSVLGLGIGLLVAAFLLGLYVIACSGWIPLAIGLVGALVVVTYAGGKLPLSHLPVGELVSGFVMGGLIPLACTYPLMGRLDWFALVFALPIMIGIGMINATNNTCDIEKDKMVERHTLAAKLGRERAPKVYKAFIVIWIACIIALVALRYTASLPWLALMLLGAFPVLRALFKNPLVQKSRDGAMAQIVSINVIFAAFYCLCIALTGSVVWM